MAQVNLLFVGDIAFFPKNVNQDILHNQNKLVLKTFQEDIKAANFEFPISNDKNNHILDWGLEGIQTTKAALKKIGAECCGAGKDEAEARTPVIINKNECPPHF
jgi:poly-gamma-glutamate capsule biosynthesis protein CapA/YwtB (metallophosphatase superfamily)